MAAEAQDVDLGLGQQRAEKSGKPGENKGELRVSRAALFFSCVTIKAGDMRVIGIREG
jgi:hypothetical protein